QALVEASVAAEDVPDPLAHFVGVLDDVEPEDVRRPRGGDQQRDQHLDRRRLAGAVRAEQAEQLALGDLERDSAHGLDLDRTALEEAVRGAICAQEVANLADGRHESSPGGGVASSCSATSMSRRSRLLSSSFSFALSAEAISPSFAACAAVDSS